MTSDDPDSRTPTTEAGAGLRIEELDLDELHEAIATADYWDPDWLDRYKLKHPAKYAALPSHPEDT